MFTDTSAYTLPHKDLLETLGIDKTTFSNAVKRLSDTDKETLDSLATGNSNSRSWNSSVIEWLEIKIPELFTDPAAYTVPHKELLKNLRLDRSSFEEKLAELSSTDAQALRPFFKGAGAQTKWKPRAADFICGLDAFQTSPSSQKTQHSLEATTPDIQQIPLEVLQHIKQHHRG